CGAGRPNRKARVGTPGGAAAWPGTGGGRADRGCLSGGGLRGAEARPTRVPTRFWLLLRASRQRALGLPVQSVPSPARARRLVVHLPRAALRPFSKNAGSY